MKININGKEYIINKRMSISTRTVVLDILRQVRQQSDENGFPEYYTAFVLMMYMISSTLATELDVENINKILEEEEP